MLLAYRARVAAEALAEYREARLEWTILAPYQPKGSRTRQPELPAALRRRWLDGDA